MIFGRNLKELRKSRKLTQEALSAAIGLSPNTISKFERGVILPSGKTIDKIAEYFGVDLGLLFLDSDSFDSNIRAIRKATSDELKKAYVDFCQEYGIEIRNRNQDRERRKLSFHSIWKMPEQVRHSLCPQCLFLKHCLYSSDSCR